MLWRISLAAMLSHHGKSRVFFRVVCAGTLLLSGNLTGCSQQYMASEGTSTDKSVKEAAVADMPAAAVPTQIAQPPSAPPYALLTNIPAADIARIQAEAKRHYLQHWPVIAKRSRYVRQRVLSVLKELNAPQELQVLPMVESGYNPYAFSYAGAMGLWQLMPRTAHGLGIQYRKTIDGRRDIETSTRAAARYLMQLHALFGNWPMALAAYHRGPSAISKRLRKQPWTPADGLKRMPVPAITRAYVRHVLGLAALERMRVIQFPEPFQTRILEIDAPVDLKRLARQADMDVRELFLFNPGLEHRQHLHGTLRLHVPEAYYEAMQAAWRASSPRFIRVVVREGDSLWTISRRYHTSIARIEKLNPGLGHYLQPGQSLTIPANSLTDVRALPNPLLSQGRRIRYRVRQGDSLWRIANRFGTTPSAIARANQLPLDALIRPGDTLWVLARIRPS